MEDLKTEIVKVLISLGDCPLAIANRLQVLGIKGKLDDWHMCPIAKFLSQHPLCFGMDVDVIFTRINIGSFSLLFREYPALKPLQSFILAFDDQDFPELIEGAA